MAKYNKDWDFDEENSYDDWYYDEDHEGGEYTIQREDLDEKEGKLYDIISEWASIWIHQYWDSEIQAVTFDVLVWPSGQFLKRFSCVSENSLDAIFNAYQELVNIVYKECKLIEVEKEKKHD